MARLNSKIPNAESISTGYIVVQKGIVGLIKNIKNNLIGYLAASLTTAIISGVAFVWSTGGVFFSLPETVKAQGDQFSDFKSEILQIINQQTQINLDQKQTNILQTQFNQTVNNNQERIETELRDINNFLRNK